MVFNVSIPTNTLRKSLLQRCLADITHNISRNQCFWNLQQPSESSRLDCNRVRLGLSIILLINNLAPTAHRYYSHVARVYVARVSRNPTTQDTQKSATRPPEIAWNHEYRTRKWQSQSLESVHNQANFESHQQASRTKPQNERRTALTSTSLKL